MKTTTNLGLKKIELTDSPPDITVQDANWDLIDKHLYSAVNYQKAGGTGTTITLNEVTLTDGFSKTFIVTTSNGGAATTINGKSLYKPGGTTAPNLIAGKAVTVWFNTAGDCFFIKASAVGDAIAENVLADKTFSNNDDTGLVGTMLNIGSIGTQSLTTQDAEYTIARGYHNGLGKVKAVITNLVSSVIKAGTTVGGIVGTFTADATAIAAQILAGATAYVNGVKVTGSMANYSGGQSAAVSSGSSSGRIFLQPSTGYHNGYAIYADDPDFVSGNIPADKNIFGLQGTMPVSTPEWSSHANVTEVSVGKYSSDNPNQNFAYFRVAPDANPKMYYNGVAWLRLAQTDLVSSNIVKGKNVLGVVGTFDGRLYNFPLSIQDAQPAALGAGHIWVKSSTLAASITTLKIYEAINAGEPNGTLMFVVGDLGYQAYYGAHTKELTSGGNTMNLSISDNTGLTTNPTSSWLVSYEAGGMVGTGQYIYLNKPMVYSKVGGVLDIETAYMWNGSSWLQLSQKGTYLIENANYEVTNGLFFNNKNGDTFTVNSNQTSGGYGGLSSSKDGTYTLSGNKVFKRTGDVFALYYTIPASIAYGGVTYTEIVSAHVAGNGSKIAVVHKYWSGSTYKYLLSTYYDNGSTMVQEVIETIESYSSTAASTKVVINSSATALALYLYYNGSQYSLFVYFKNGTSWTKTNPSTAVTAYDLVFSYDDVYLLFTNYNSTHKVDRLTLDYASKTISATTAIYSDGSSTNRAEQMIAHPAGLVFYYLPALSAWHCRNISTGALYTIAGYGISFQAYKGCFNVTGDRFIATYAGNRRYISLSIVGTTVTTALIQNITAPANILYEQLIPW